MYDIWCMIFFGFSVPVCSMYDQSAILMTPTMLKPCLHLASILDAGEFKIMS